MQPVKTPLMMLLASITPATTVAAAAQEEAEWGGAEDSARWDFNSAADVEGRALWRRSVLP
jgi:hypothetical protein